MRNRTLEQMWFFLLFIVLVIALVLAGCTEGTQCVSGYLVHSFNDHNPLWCRGYSANNGHIEGFKCIDRIDRTRVESVIFTEGYVTKECM